MTKLILISLVIGWVDYLPIRNLPGNGIINDIQNHLSKDVTGNDKINKIHEGTHFINSNLRTKYRKPGFYCLSNKAFIFSKELPGTLDEISKKIPKVLRGNAYNLYLIKQQRDWNKQSSYLFDEQSAYINASESRNKNDRTDTVENMLEFIVYTYYAATTTDSKIFWKWQTKRSLEIYKRSGLHFDYADIPEFKEIIKVHDYKVW